MTLLIGMICALSLIAYVTLLVSDYMDTGKLDYKALPKNPDAQFHCVALKDIDMAPTIIPASGGNE